MKEIEVYTDEIEEMLTDMVAEVMADMEEEQAEEMATLEDFIFEDDESDEEIALQSDDDDIDFSHIEDDDVMEPDSFLGENSDDEDEQYDYSFPRLEPEEGGGEEDISIDEPELLELSTVAIDDYETLEEEEEEWDETMAADYDYYDSLLEEEGP